MNSQDVSLSILPHDVATKILALLPLKSIHRCKWVSKSWLHLITTEVLKKPPPPAGFIFQSIHTKLVYHAGGAIDVGPAILSFLPSRRTATILDSRNGLLLCSGSDRAFYVCNPITKTWAALPPHPQMIGEPWRIVAFEPSESPHYAVLYAARCGWSVYSSESRAWHSTHFDGKDGVLRNNWDSDPRDLAVWNGDAYVVRGRMEGASVKRVRLETTRVRLGEGMEETIKFPADRLAATMYVHHAGLKPGTCIGNMGGDLCFANLHGFDLLVWRLGGRRDGWELKHAVNNLKALLGLDPLSSVPGPSILGFHPTSEVVFIMDYLKVYSLDLDTMLLKLVFTLGTLYSQAFPLSPCLLDAFGDDDAAAPC